MLDPFAVQGEDGRMLGRTPCLGLELEGVVEDGFRTLVLRLCAGLICGAGPGDGSGATGEIFTASKSTIFVVFRYDCSGVAFVQTQAGALARLNPVSLRWQQNLEAFCAFNSQSFDGTWFETEFSIGTII
jgi:hypothetical protein